MALGPRHDRMMSATLHMVPISIGVGISGRMSHVRLRSGNIRELCLTADLPVTSIGV